MVPVRPLLAVPVPLIRHALLVGIPAGLSRLVHVGAHHLSMRRQLASVPSPALAEFQDTPRTSLGSGTHRGGSYAAWPGG